MLYSAIICNRFAQLQFLISVAPAIQTCLFLNKSGTPPTTPAISYKNSAGSLVRLNLYAAPWCPWYPHLLIQNIQPSIEAKCPPVPRALSLRPISVIPWSYSNNILPYANRFPIKSSNIINIFSEQYFVKSLF